MMLDHNMFGAIGLAVLSSLARWDAIEAGPGRAAGSAWPRRRPGRAARDS